MQSMQSMKHPPLSLINPYKPHPIIVSSYLLTLACFCGSWWTAGGVFGGVFCFSFSLIKCSSLPVVGLDALLIEADLTCNSTHGRYEEGNVHFA